MADTAHDQAHTWMIAQLHQVLCGGTKPPRGDRLGQAVHAGHDYDARDILDGCEVREEWGVRYGDDAHWFLPADDEAMARRWVAVATGVGSPAGLCRRYVITTPTTEVSDG